MNLDVKKWQNSYFQTMDFYKQQEICRNIKAFIVGGKRAFLHNIVLSMDSIKFLHSNCIDTKTCSWSRCPRFTHTHVRAQIYWKCLKKVRVARTYGDPDECQASLEMFVKRTGKMRRSWDENWQKEAERDSGGFCQRSLNDYDEYAF